MKNMSFILVSILVIIIIIIVSNIYKRKFEYWKVRGVPGPEPRWIFGNIKDSFLNKKTPLQIFCSLYSEYEGLPLIGAFKGSQPCLIIRDPGLIKELVVEEFTSFHNNELHVDKNVDPLYGRNPFVLKGEEWKFTRSILRPFFTSTKMKHLFPLLRKSGLDLSALISNCYQTGAIEAKALALQFTLSNVTNCALGLDIQNEELLPVVERFSKPDYFAIIKVFVLPLFPFLANILPFKYVPGNAEAELISLVKTSLKIRDENLIVQNDFLHYLSNLQDAKLSDLEIAAHVAGFFMDGYETSATVLSFALYELARTPEVQSKLREQIQLKFKFRKDESITYEDIQEIPYLEAVISETLRLNPPVFSLGKTCTKNYLYQSTSSKVNDFVIEKGTPLYLPIFQIHRDPQHFQNPDEFIPERFLLENKGNIKKYTFLPFGEGPRSCLGKKFGLLQIKIALFFIIKQFSLTVNSRTTVPFKYDAIYFISSVENGLWIDFENNR